jgi:hypothetical protein
MSGELKVPPDTMICLRALMMRDDCWLGWRGLVGTTWTPTARSPSKMTYNVGQYMFLKVVDQVSTYLLNLVAG